MNAALRAFSNKFSWREDGQNNRWHNKSLDARRNSDSVIAARVIFSVARRRFRPRQLNRYVALGGNENAFMNKHFSKLINSNLKFVFAVFALVFTVGCLSVKPIYNADEQAKAERSVAELTKLYNEQKLEELYNLFDEEARQSMNKDEVLTNMKQSFEKTGKIQSAKLSEAKIFPSPPIQVRMIYNVTSEKGGDFQEWFVWVNREDKARLLQIQTFPGTDKPEGKQ